MPNIPFPLRGGTFTDYANREREIAQKGKFWAVVERNLRAVLDNDAKNQDLRVYFGGGTLCIDGKNSLYMLSISGKGSIAPTNPPSWNRNCLVILPDFITQLVQQLYLQTKGPNEYFENNYKDIAWV